MNNEVFSFGGLKQSSRKEENEELFNVDFMFYAFSVLKRFLSQNTHERNIKQHLMLSSASSVVSKSMVALEILRTTLLCCQA